MNFRRISRYGLVAGAVAGVIAALHGNQWDIGTFGIVRFGRAAATVGKIAVDYKYSFYNADPNSEGYAALKHEVNKRSAMRLLDLCCANGGVFIKVGQHLGALDHLLPVEYVSCLKVLHNRAPESSRQDVLRVIKEDLKKDPEELFSTFDYQPIGAASLAQVYKAVTKEGDVVAVKVQHLHVKKRAFVDMKTMEILTHLVSKAFPDFQLLWLAEEMKKNLPIELDFVQEGKNAERVRKMFRHYKWFKVPRIYWHLSTDRVLTMEFCEGGQVNDRKYMQDHGIPVQQVTRNLGKLYSDMIFVQGYVHCDPHPGNILVDNSSGTVKIVLLDHGLYVTLTDSFRLKYANMWLALIHADVEEIKRHAASMGVTGFKGKLLASMMTARAWRTVQTGIDRKMTEDEDGAIKEFVAQHLTMIAEILGLVPREMLFIFKTNDLLRSIEYALKSPPSASSFINMSRCCVNAIADERLQWCESRFSKLRVVCSQRWILFKISLYETYIWFRSTIFARTFFTSKNLLLD